MAGTLERLRRCSGDGFEDLPRADRDLLDVAADPATSAEAIAAAVAQRAAEGRLRGLLPRRIARTFGRESVLRRYARYLVDRGR